VAADLAASAVDEGAQEGDDVATESARPCNTGRKWVRWSAKLKRGFLDHLASTCDVKASAMAIGVDPSSVYHLRRKDAAFAADWDAALKLGYQMVETRLIGFVLSGGESEAEPDLPGKRFDWEQALRVLAIHRQVTTGKAAPARGGPTRRYATSDETDALLRRQLEALAKRLGTA
jgi:hypothetical protein